MEYNLTKALSWYGTESSTSSSSCTSLARSALDTDSFVPVTPLSTTLQFWLPWAKKKNDDLQKCTLYVALALSMAANARAQPSIERAWFRREKASHGGVTTNTSTARSAVGGAPALAATIVGFMISG